MIESECGEDAGIEKSAEFGVLPDCLLRDSRVRRANIVVPQIPNLKLPVKDSVVPFTKICRHLSSSTYFVDGNAANTHFRTASPNRKHCG